MKGTNMALSFKCIGVLENGDKKPLFNGKSFTQFLLLFKRLETALKHNRLLPYKQIIIEKTETFARGPKAVLWPDGHKLQVLFSVDNGNIDINKLDKAFMQHRTPTEKTKVVRYFYEEKYAVGRNPAAKCLPRDVDAVIFIEKLKHISFDKLNCVILCRETTDTKTKDQTCVELMLYNPKYMYDTKNVIIGSKHAAQLKTRPIYKRDLPFTSHIIHEWVENPEKISQNLIRFFAKHNGK